ncbi:MAG: DMT family transporter [Alicyclobacillus sp.]|nr:DMT family transporter [Alicyclobacillus sp.]
MATNTQRGSFRGSLGIQIGCLVLAWGLSWPVYKAALTSTPPLLFAGMRTLLGGLLLAIPLLFSRRPVQLRACWPSYAWTTLFNVIGFYALQTLGLRFMPEGEFTSIVYLQPVLVGLMAWWWLGEGMNARKLCGLCVGFAGVAILGFGRSGQPWSLPGVVMALGTAVSWAAGTVYAKRVHGKVDVLWLVALPCTAGGALLTVAGLAAENVYALHSTFAYWTGLLYGGVMGVAVSWLLYYHLVQQGEASRVAAWTFLVPLLAVAVGVVWLHEQLTWTLLAGLGLVAVSIFLVNRRSTRAHRLHHLPGDELPAAK